MVVATAISDACRARTLKILYGRDVCRVLHSLRSDRARSNAGWSGGVDLRRICSVGVLLAYTPLSALSGARHR
jgi:hypothetical protein